MTRQLLITNFCHHQVAIIEEGRLCQLLTDEQAGRFGDVYVAKVMRILPTLNVAFVDIGENKNAILTLTKTITQGQMLIVQITRPAYAQKGAIVTAVIELMTPYLVYKPQEKTVVVSAKIPKQRVNTLKQTMSDLLEQRCICGGITVRTYAQDADEQLLKQHLMYLSDIWQNILSTKTTKTPKRLYRMPLPLLALSEFSQISSVLIDDKVMYDEWFVFTKQYLPHLSVSYHQVGLFAKHHVYTQLNQALNARVDLPSGAYLVIDECEAMTVIDVNTGAMTQSSKNAIYQANLEAIKIILHELVLRQIGGLVVVDLISMSDKKHHELIYQEFKKILSYDHAKIHLSPISQFGLIELSREQKFLSLADQYTHDCPTCQGMGRVNTFPAIKLALMTQLIKLTYQLCDKDEVILRLSTAFEAFLACDDDFAKFITTLPFSLHIKTMTNYTDDKYDILQNKHR